MQMKNEELRMKNEELSCLLKLRSSQPAPCGRPGKQEKISPSSSGGDAYVYFERYLNNYCLI
jgi:hypothetical protein